MTDPDQPDAAKAATCPSCHTTDSSVCSNGFHVRGRPDTPAPLEPEAAKAASRYAVEWTTLSGRGPINRYDRQGLGLDMDRANEFLRRVTARAEFVEGQPFVGRIVPMEEAHAR